MLRVPTYVGPSRISGMGLFAARDIPAGEVVWEFTEGIDWRIPAADFELFPEPYRSRMRHYLYEDEPGRLVLCGDNARFMNHDPDPNCDDTGPWVTVTRRPVAAGEELTCDYRTFDVGARENGLDFGGDRGGEAVRPGPGSDDDEERRASA